MMPVSREMNSNKQYEKVNLAKVGGEGISSKAKWR